MPSYRQTDKHLAEGTAHEVLAIRSRTEHDTRGDLPLFYRFVVIETIFDPTIIDDKKAAYFEHQLGVSNIQYSRVLPRNAIIGQRVLGGTNSASEPPLFLFPFFPPNLSLPCKPGEHVWAMFEDPNKRVDLGYWFCRIVEPGFVEDVNHTHAPRAHDPSFAPGTRDAFEGNTQPKYEFRNGRGDEVSGQRYTVAETASIPGDDEKAYEKLVTQTDGAKLAQLEAIPRYRKRPGDVVLEGTNNALIAVGRDRVGNVATFVPDDAQGQKAQGTPAGDVTGAGTGMIDIVVGRGQTERTGGKKATNSLGESEIDKSVAGLSRDEGDPDFATDKSRVLVSQRTLVDKNFNINTFNSKFGVSDDRNGNAAVVTKSDKVRIIARKDLEILVTNDSNSSDDWVAFIAKKDCTLHVPANAVAKIECGSIKVEVSSKGVKLGNDTAVDMALAPGLKDYLSALEELVMGLATAIDAKLIPTPGISTAAVKTAIDGPLSAAKLALTAKLTKGT